MDKLLGNLCNSVVIFTVLFIVSLTSAENINVLKFDWYDGIKPDEIKFSVSVSTNDLIQEHAIYEGKVILQSTNFTSEYPSAVAYQKSPGFVDTVFYSYKNHHNLIIRPDDVWCAIMIQFSLYVQANAEELRFAFVNFEGKKDLEVIFTAPVDEVPVNVFISEIVALINANIEPSVSNWILPNFTTTTENDRLTAGAAMMATLKHYFNYKLSTILCGIPEVTILGSVEDWRDIRKRVNRLKDFELNGKNKMEKWSEMLEQILDEFVKVKEGKTKDAKFWKEVIRLDYKWVNDGYVSTNKTFLNGWITAFSAFDESGIWRQDLFDEDIENLREEKDDRWLSIATNKITSGVVQVPIKIKDKWAKPEEQEYSGAIYSRHLGYGIQNDKITLQPISGWAMAITSNPPEYIRKKIGYDENQ